MSRKNKKTKHEKLIMKLAVIISALNFLTRLLELLKEIIFIS